MKTSLFFIAFILFIQLFQCTEEARSRPFKKTRVLRGRFNGLGKRDPDQKQMTKRSIEDYNYDSKNSSYDPNWFDGQPLFPLNPPLKKASRFSGLGKRFLLSPLLGQDPAVVMETRAANRFGGLGKKNSGRFGGLGKRPTAQRYSGLGKRHVVKLASRFAGLGKRLNRFGGLGKRDEDDNENYFNSASYFNSPDVDGANAFDGVGGDADDMSDASVSTGAVDRNRMDELRTTDGKGEFSMFNSREGGNNNDASFNKINSIDDGAVVADLYGGVEMDKNVDTNMGGEEIGVDQRAASRFSGLG